MAADAVECHVRQARADRWKHLLREPAHGIDVRRMMEAAHEHQVAALRERLSATCDPVQVRQHFDPRVRRIDAQQIAFDVADHQRRIGVGDGVQFQRSRALGGARRCGVAAHFGAATLAQIVQIHGVEDQRRLRRVPAQQRDEFADHVMAAHHHGVEARAVFA